jgi:hypothetical protein
MAVPRDYIVYIDKDTNKTVAILAWTDDEYQSALVEANGHKIIGKVSSGSETDAREYGDVQLR